MLKLQHIVGTTQQAKAFANPLLEIYMAFDLAAHPAQPTIANQSEIEHGHAPRVSIGLPVYNGAAFLRETLDSLLAQTFTDHEIIISDNASTDETEAICRHYASIDPRVRYYRNSQNLGGAWNYQRVFQLARGAYFKWQAHDDLCHPEFLARCVEVLDQRQDVVVCFSHTIIIDEHGTTLLNYVEDLNLDSPHPHKRYVRYLQHDPECPLCSVYFGLTRRDVLQHTQLIKPYVNSEFSLMCELALRGAFHELPEYLFYRRDHPDISTRAYKTVEERIEWYAPQLRTQRKGTPPGWLMLSDHVRAVTQVPMHWADKLRCYLVVSQFFIWLVQGALRRTATQLSPKSVPYHEHSEGLG
jgi:glycosyltransferase involved in cell wall biosynthesis